MSNSEPTPESFRQRPDVVRAVENPRSPRSVLNYMCGSDTADPETRHCCRGCSRRWHNR